MTVLRNFFRKMVIVNGNAAPRVAEDGIITVGVIPFLLDRSILTLAMSGE